MLLIFQEHENDLIDLVIIIPVDCHIHRKSAYPSGF